MDEINSVQDVQVVQSIVARGIRVIAGASACTSLASLLTNPDLSSLVRCATAVGSSFVPQTVATQGLYAMHGCCVDEPACRICFWSVLTLNATLAKEHCVIKAA